MPYLITLSNGETVTLDVADIGAAYAAATEFAERVGSDIHSIEREEGQ